MDAQIKTRNIIEAKVIRADGTVEDLGVIADSAKNEVKADESILQKIRRKLTNG